MTSSPGIKKSSAIFLRTESTQPCWKKSMPKSTRANSHRCRDFACASFLLEVLSLVAATDSETGGQELCSVQVQSASSVARFQETQRRHGQSFLSANRGSPSGDRPSYWQVR